MKVLIALAILTITSGCVSTPLIEPLCLPDRPVLVPITVEEQIEINPSTLLKIAINDAELKSWVKLAERTADVHNKQFKATCSGDTE